ncbi:MAG TPA: hypothetical protein VFC00_04580 [Micromonosporaceae bacterium]|nr:hypothetical protein [Micromonosporaceae bacterium]
MITRRLATAAALGVLAVAGLAGCRSEPTVAAYVGDHSYKTEEVERIYDQVRTARSLSPSPDATPSPGAQPQPAAPVSRQQVLSALVGRDLAMATAAAKGVEPDAETISQLRTFLSQQFGIPADTEYIKVFSEYVAHVEALVGQKTATSPSDADLQLVLDRLVQAGLAEPTSLDEARAGLGANNLGLIARYSEVRNDLAAQASKDNVVINPRYAPAELNVLELTSQDGQRYPLVTVPLDADTGAPVVVDQSH